MYLMTLQSCCGTRQIIRTEIEEVPYKELVPVPEFMTKPIWMPELPEKVTCGFAKNELIPTLFSQARQCNKQLLEIKNLKVDEKND